MAPEPDPIDLWSVLVPDCSPQLLDEYRRLLSPDERARETRFHFPRDRARYLVTRALVRTVLARYAPVPAGAWAFGEAEHGRPVIASPRDDAADLRFNISHAGDLVVLAVRRGGDVGVDTESLRRPAPVDLADRFFSPEEARALRALPADARGGRFFQYWTLKESYIKARGFGLSIPLDGFGFHFPASDRIEISISPALGDRRSWWFWQMRSPDEEHLVALCAERTSDARPVVRWRSVVPLAGERESRFRLIAASS